MYLNPRQQKVQHCISIRIRIGDLHLTTHSLTQSSPEVFTDVLETFVRERNECNSQEQLRNLVLFLRPCLTS